MKSQSIIFFVNFLEIVALQILFLCKIGRCQMQLLKIILYGKRGIIIIF